MMSSRRAFWTWALCALANVGNVGLAIHYGHWWLLALVVPLLGVAVAAMWIISVAYHHPERYGLPRSE